eukprot:CAMPEP_0171457100 /NCGR_PEP_ID=MMETSP0945-20130129/3314_1 /TAXON_ID=109269 /ORGANISM="Vaucheria litorea, Strain CCMP2940" /LENGTH=285 /DNA_ID=CAMNT_0011982641 /DNA_START=60 /DNA_END=917 /DNA_ORIENTATION=-
MFKLVLFISLFLASKALKITLLNLSSYDAIDSYFVAAANRWEEIITSDLSDYYVFSGYWLGEDYSYFDYDGFVDDILIAYDFQTMPLEVLAGTAVALKRDDPDDYYYYGFPLTSYIVVNISNIQNMIDNGTLYDTILHEMGHALGFGSLWPTKNGCASPFSKYYGGLDSCLASLLYYLYTADDLEIETDLGEGSAYSHWDEDQLGNELMTPTSDANSPITLVTLYAFRDLGYSVDYSKADSFSEVIPENRRKMKESGTKHYSHHNDIIRGKTRGASEIGAYMIKK